MFADIPRGRSKGSDQSTGENASSLQRAKAEDLAGMARVIAPIHDDVQNLRAYNAAEHDHDAEVPCIIRIDALPRRVADTDPKSE